MTKADLVEAVCQADSGLTKKEAAELVDEVFATLKGTLKQGEQVKITGFGAFVTRDKKERMGRNPQTGAPMLIAARRVVTFKTSEILKKNLNPQV